MNIDALRKLLLSDLYTFTKYFYKETTGQKFIPGNHFKLISDKLEGVYDGQIKRLIINMPPRFGKTEMAVKNFIAKGIALNPASKYIHTSYSETLALDNSESIKDLILSEPYRSLFNISIKKDSKAKQKWYTSGGGGLYATSSGGQITGFGAGIMQSENPEGKFGGAIIIDDPLKPEDGNSPVMRKRINDRFYNTILSRVNDESTPIIVIGQRIHKEDLFESLLNSGDWDSLILPAISGGEYLWPHRADVIEEIKKNKPHIFQTQYQQNPTLEAVDSPFIYAFSQDRHYTAEPYEIQDREVQLSFDFNKSPCTLLVSQKDDKGYFHSFDIILADEKTLIGKTPLEAVCELFKRKYLDSGKVLRSRIMVTGDATGRRGSADYIGNMGNYTKIMNYLQLDDRMNFSVLKTNMKHTTSRDLCNDFINNCVYLIHEPAKRLADEMKLAYADEKGTLNKAKDELGLHILDAWRYQVQYWHPLEKFLSKS